MNPKTAFADNHPKEFLAAVSIWTQNTSSRQSNYDRQRILMGIPDNKQKSRAAGFFRFCSHSAEDVSPADVAAWIHYLFTHRLKASTIYNMVNQLHNFFDYLKNYKHYQHKISQNPVTAARQQFNFPKASTKKQVGLSDPDLSKLLDHLRSLEASQDLNTLRDIAIFYFHFYTSLSPQEIARLQFQDIEIRKPYILIRDKNLQIASKKLKQALKNYLRSSERWHPQETPQYPTAGPLWLRHDIAAQSQQKTISAASIAESLKNQAKTAKLETFNINLLRHTQVQET